MTSDAKPGCQLQDARTFHIFTKLLLIFAPVAPVAPRMGEPVGNSQQKSIIVTIKVKIYEICVNVKKNLYFLFCHVINCTMSSIMIKIVTHSNRLVQTLEVREFQVDKTMKSIASLSEESILTSRRGQK